MLNKQSYRHLLRICNIYCLATATDLARTRPNVNGYELVHDLSCCVL